MDKRKAREEKYREIVAERMRKREAKLLPTIRINPALFQRRSGGVGMSFFLNQDAPNVYALPTESREEQPSTLEKAKNIIEGVGSAVGAAVSAYQTYQAIQKYRPQIKNMLDRLRARGGNTGAEEEEYQSMEQEFNDINAQFQNTRGGRLLARGANGTGNLLDDDITEADLEDFNNSFEGESEGGLSFRTAGSVPESARTLPEVEPVRDFTARMEALREGRTYRPAPEGDGNGMRDPAEVEAELGLGPETGLQSENPEDLPSPPEGDIATGEGNVSELPRAPLSSIGSKMKFNVKPDEGLDQDLFNEDYARLQRGITQNELDQMESRTMNRFRTQTDFGESAQARIARARTIANDMRARGRTDESIRQYEEDSGLIDRQPGRYERLRAKASDLSDRINERVQNLKTRLGNQFDRVSSRLGDSDINKFDSFDGSGPNEFELQDYNMGGGGSASSSAGFGSADSSMSHTYSQNFDESTTGTTTDVGSSTGETVSGTAVSSDATGADLGAQAAGELQGELGIAGALGGAADVSGAAEAAEGAATADEFFEVVAFF